MLAPIPVELVPHDPAWAEAAQHEAARLQAAAGLAIIVVHHIGSTAIPGIRAKPILDLMPLLRSLADFDEMRPAIEGLGYAWWGEYGIPGRPTAISAIRSPASARSTCIASRKDRRRWRGISRSGDYLRFRPDLARAYDAEKGRCRELHPLDSHAYTDCKDAWIRKVEAEALAAFGAC
jgi:GrpB-like predicted nucleotidyltransferase (UPF0157 family)